MGDIDLLKRLLNIPKRNEEYAYQMGYDCGINGANTTNCNLAIFSCVENTREWERGNRDGLKAREDA
jgi:ribosome modulation factor